MFTGIVEKLGRVLSVSELDTSASGGGGFSIVIGDLGNLLEDVHLGDSICCNGVCLTVTEFDEKRTFFKVNCTAETIRKTNLGALKADSPINLERAMTASTRFGGHMVEGHVDTMCRIASIVPDPPNSFLYTFKVLDIAGSDVTPKTAFNYVVPKGYVAIDGTSLTVVDTDPAQGTFRVMLIPHTLASVVLGKAKAGDAVNLEVDIMGKYVERIAKGILENEQGGLLENVVRRVVKEEVEKALKGKL
ncbi:hypothetical protein DFJ74DRAFT_76075 [Hyaloraphidium curvatum]|nr:hypothetical protein DFJ74DRAFT_76075 [Hyaloraphidium curvatum]